MATCVKELRRALGDDAKSPRFISTVHGRGYRFVANVTTEPVGEVPPGSEKATKSPKRILVGRDVELAQLQGWYGDILKGQRRVIFVSGEVGIGKTVFAQAFLNSIPRKDAARLGRGQCIEQYGSGEPYMPVLEALGELVRGRGGEGVVELLNKFAPTWLAQMPELLKSEERARLQRECQGVTQRRMLREMVQAPEALSAQSPLVLLLEDLHWSDLSTLELISAIARRNEPARLLIVGTYRSAEILAKDHPLIATKNELELHHYCEELRLKLLSEEDLVEYLATRYPRDDSRQYRTLASLIHARTGGNPLFIVNVFDNLLGRAALTMRSPDVRRLEEALMADNFDPPRSIREMIERNLERLGPEEQVVLECASVVGPEFSAASVAAALERPLEEIEACCARLSSLDQFVSARETSTWPDGTVAADFRFHHTLYRDVLYSRLAGGRRALLHRRIAAREEQGYGPRVAEIANKLAHHYGRANDMSKAIEYLRLAGETAVARGAFMEAERAYRQALKILELLGSPEHDVHELALMNQFARVIQLTRGWAAPEASEAAARTRSLAEKAGGLQELVIQAISTWATVAASGDLASASMAADELLKLAKHDGSPVSLGAAYTAQVISRYGLGGDLKSAEEHFMLGAPFFESASNVFPGSAANLFGAASHVAWLRGYADTARDRSRKGNVFANQLNSSFEAAYAQFWAAALHVFIGEHERAETLAMQAVALSSEHGFSQITSMARIVLGRAEASLHRADTGVQQIREGLSGRLKAGAGLATTLYVCWLAEALAADDDISGAVATIGEALQANPGELAWRVYALTVRAELLLKLGQTEEAESTCRCAIEQAKKIDAKALELRGTITLARLLQKQNEHEEARAMLVEIYGWFTEGLDTFALNEAKALLDKLSEVTSPSRVRHRIGNCNHSRVPRRSGNSHMP